MSRRSSDYKPIAEINVVPYIDVMLVLLIIFMVTAPLLVRSVDVELPVVEGSTTLDEVSPPIVVGISNQGSYFIVDEKTGDPGEIYGSEAEVVAAAIAQLLGERQRKIRVYADKDVRYEKVLKLLQGLQKSIDLNQLPEKTVRLISISNV